MIDAAKIAKVQAQMADLIARHGVNDLARVIECVKINATRSFPPLPPLQEPQTFFFPGLDDKPWYDPDQYEETRWATGLIKDAFTAIRDEFQREVRSEDLIPYEEQVEEARELRERGNETGVLLPAEQWGTFSLVLGGQLVEENCRRCPETKKLVDELGDLMGIGGALFFSVLGPQAKIPAHHGMSNMRLTCHMGIEVPPDCAIRVGDEVRTWKEGECILFEDTFEHEVWNRSNKRRVCLMLDLWNPKLTPVEREALGMLQKTLES